MNREIISYCDGDSNQTAEEKINGYCCNMGAQVIQMQVIIVDNKIRIFALIDYDS